MSAEKDPLSVAEEDEELGGEDEFEDDELHEIVSCKYCDFQTTNVEDLDEHIVTHEEAVLDDSDELEEAEEAITQDEASRPPRNNSMSSILSSDTEEPRNKTKPYTITNDSSVIKRPKQDLPAFFQEFANKPNKKIFVCPYCGYQSMKKLDMNKHINEHREPIELPVYACAECVYTTRRKCDMPKHLLTHCENGTVPMYRCDECPYMTKRKGDLSKHTLCHSKPTANLYTCSECPYSSKRHGDLKKHMASHEIDMTKDNYLYNCTECGYTSKRLNDLHKHAALHCDRTVKGVFKCTKCDYASATGSHFAKHVLSHCRIREMAVSIFPKDNTMQEYIVLEEEELHLYQLDKNNVASVEVNEKDASVLRNNRKRKMPDNSQHSGSKKVSLQSYYVDVKAELEESELEDAGNKESEKSKVVVLTGFQDNEQNAES